WPRVGQLGGLTKLAARAGCLRYQCSKSHGGLPDACDRIMNLNHAEELAFHNLEVPERAINFVPHPVMDPASTGSILEPLRNDLVLRSLARFSSPIRSVGRNHCLSESRVTCSEL